MTGKFKDEFDNRQQRKTREEAEAETKHFEKVKADASSEAAKNRRTFGNA